MLEINDFINRILVKSLTLSFGFRSVIYCEGQLRMSCDLDIDLYARWPSGGDVLWMMVPCINILALDLFKKRIVLEIGCANGWAYRNIYSKLRNVSYCGFDISKEAINEGKRKLKIKVKRQGCKLDARFIVADAVDDMPKGNFTHVFWYASICMFEKEKKIKNIKEHSPTFAT